MSYEKAYIRGLKNVAACETRLSFVDPHGGLYYAGYDIDRLLGRVCYEEIVHLLLYNKLPNQSELNDIQSKLISEMKLPEKIIQNLRSFPKTSPPLRITRTEISNLEEYDPDPEDYSEPANMRRALRLIAMVPTLVATLHRIRSNQEILYPKKEYGFSENFLYLFRGKTADKIEKEAIDRYMILHADHGLNASTFAARVTASTLSDMYSATTSAIGTLKGTLHGGASERVMNMLLEVDNVGEVEAYIKGLLFDKKRIMGFGHRVYEQNDPRSIHLKKVSKALCIRTKKMGTYRKAKKMEAIVHKEKKIYPNVDFYAAIVLNALGIPKEFCTLFFASSRIAGWTAHILEQYSDSVLLRPTSRYNNSYGTKFISLQNR